MSRQSNLITIAPRLKAGLVLAAALLLGACGGGGSGTGTGTSANPGTTANVPPSANAGIDQIASEQVTVTLDGTASDDSDGTIATVAWTQTAGVGVALGDATALSPTFFAPVGTAGQSLTFEINIADNDGAMSTDSVVISITSNPALSADYKSNPDLSGQFVDAVLVNRNPDCRAYVADANAGDYSSAQISDLSNFRWQSTNHATKKGRKHALRNICNMGTDRSDTCGTAIRFRGFGIAGRRHGDTDALS